jgi:hypothetical protein
VWQSQVGAFVRVYTCSFAFPLYPRDQLSALVRSNFVGTSPLQDGHVQVHSARSEEGSLLAVVGGRTRSISDQVSPGSFGFIGVERTPRRKETLGLLSAHLLGTTRYIVLLSSRVRLLFSALVPSRAPFSLSLSLSLSLCLLSLCLLCLLLLFILSVVPALPSARVLYPLLLASLLRSFWAVLYRCCATHHHHHTLFTSPFHCVCLLALIGCDKWEDYEESGGYDFKIPQPISWYTEVYPKLEPSLLPLEVIQVGCEWFSYACLCTHQLLGRVLLVSRLSWFLPSLLASGVSWCCFRISWCCSPR